MFNVLSENKLAVYKHTRKSPSTFCTAHTFSSKSRQQNKSEKTFVTAFYLQETHQYMK